MQQKTHDFLVRMQVPMATFGGDLMGEAIDFAIHEMRNNRFVTLTDIEMYLAIVFTAVQVQRMHGFAGHWT